MSRRESEIAELKRMYYQPIQIPQEAPKDTRGFGWHPLCWIVAWTLFIGLSGEDQFLERFIVGIVVSLVYWGIIRPLWLKYRRWYRDKYAKLGRLIRSRN